MLAPPSDASGGHRTRGQQRAERGERPAGLPSGGPGTGPAPRGRAGPCMCDAQGAGCGCSRRPGARTRRRPAPGLPGLQPHGPRRAPPASRRPQRRPTGPQALRGRRGPLHLALHPWAPQAATHKTHTHTHTHTQTTVSDLAIHTRLGTWCTPFTERQPSPTLPNRLYAQSHGRRLKRPRKL